MSVGTVEALERERAHWERRAERVRAVEEGLGGLVDRSEEIDYAEGAAFGLALALEVVRTADAVALMQEPHECDRCGTVYDEASGDGYCGLCPACADATEPDSETDDGEGVVG